jgi:hypothetical protein
LATVLRATLDNSIATPYLDGDSVDRPNDPSEAERPHPKARIDA